MLWAALFVAIALTSAALVVELRRPASPEAGHLDAAGAVEDFSAVAQALHLRQQEDHPVTDSMRDAADGQAGHSAPPFELRGDDGEIHTLEQLTTTKPLMIFFVEKECPCCLGAKVFVDMMVELYPDEMNVVGIINADGEVARQWRESTQPKFLVLEDPNQQAISAYGAIRGVYTTLVAPGGLVEIAYPGYSIDMLRDLSKRIARLAQVPPREFVSRSAPTKLTSGCVFPEKE